MSHYTNNNIDTCSLRLSLRTCTVQVHHVMVRSKLSMYDYDNAPHPLYSWPPNTFLFIPFAPLHIIPERNPDICHIVTEFFMTYN